MAFTGNPTPKVYNYVGAVWIPMDSTFGIHGFEVLCNKYNLVRVHPVAQHIKEHMANSRGQLRYMLFHGLDWILSILQVVKLNKSV